MGDNPKYMSDIKGDMKAPRAEFKAELMITISLQVGIWVNQETH